MRVVADTSVFIVLDRIGHLDVLPRLFGSVVRPRSVLDELLAGDAGHPPSAAVKYLASDLELVAEEHAGERG